MANDKDALINMGFEAARGHSKPPGTVASNPQWIFYSRTRGKPIPDLSSVTESTSRPPRDAMDVDDDEEDAEALKSLGVKVANDVEAKSIKCSECGKIFRNTALAQFHAEKSGHQEFEESTEEVAHSSNLLTEEEKKQKLAELRQKMAEKRANKAIEEAKEAKANETLRRKTGKDMGAIKEEMEKRQALKDAEQKKKDKIEDAKARELRSRLKSRLTRRRAQKSLLEKRLFGMASKSSMLRLQLLLRQAPPLLSVASPAEITRRPDSRYAWLAVASHTQPLYRVMLRYGKWLNFWLGKIWRLTWKRLPLLSTFPRKTFSPSDFSKSLRELGLTPSAVLIAS
ncbi:hypothetical protein MVEN_01040700 [Mycena venus]|uniref:C2H2-type domain-containing protein n=1 Tax=Mycena venus TaxID=2733690 RepID=A0A8H7D052_9AGAR|nr:hypothetical protein MVEN_01040700 [Mycena venus]